MHVISDLSNVLERNDVTQPSKHRSTKPLYIVRLSFSCIYGIFVPVIVIVSGSWRQIMTKKDKRVDGLVSHITAVLTSKCE